MTRSERSTNRPVRFRPPGLDRKERVGEIFHTHVDTDWGTTYYVEDTAGNKFQLAPASILAPEETL